MTVLEHLLRQWRSLYGKGGWPNSTGKIAYWKNSPPILRKNGATPQRN